MNNQIKSPRQDNVDMCATNTWAHGQTKQTWKKKAGVGGGLISFLPVLKTLHFSVTFKYKTAHNNDFNKEVH